MPAFLREISSQVLSEADINRIASYEADVVRTPPVVLYARWNISLSQSIAALCNAAEATQMFSADMNNLSAEKTGIALVRFANAEGQHIELVQWTLPGRGRVADIDCNNCLVTIVPVGRKQIPTDFRDNGVVLHPSTGLRMERVRKKERTPVPNHILRLREIWKVTLSDNQQDLLLLLDIDEQQRSETLLCSEYSCCFCGSNKNLLKGMQPSGSGLGQSALDEHEGTSNNSNYDFVYQCCLCQMHWHTQCNNEFCTAIAVTKRTESDVRYRIANQFDHTVTWTDLQFEVFVLSYLCPRLRGHIDRFVYHKCFCIEHKVCCMMICYYCYCTYSMKFLLGLLG